MVKTVIAEYRVSDNNNDNDKGVVLGKVDTVLENKTILLSEPNITYTLHCQSLFNHPKIFTKVWSNDNHKSKTKINAHA